MGIRALWNSLEATLKANGWPLVDTDEVPQPGRVQIRISEVNGQQNIRGTIGSGKVSLSFVIQTVLIYDATADKRLERTIAEDAEGLIHAIYNDVNLSNHHFLGGAIVRDPTRGQVTNTLRWDFQAQVTS